MIAHSQEYWDGYKAALELVGMMVEKDVNICKDIAVKAKGEGDTIKKEFAEIAKSAYENTQRDINKIKSDIPEVE